MAKIGKRHCTIYHKDIHKEFTYDMLYNANDLFHAPLPEEFNESFDHLSESELKELSAKKAYKGKWKKVDFKRIVWGVNEGECEINMKKIISKLIDSEIKQRKVIVLFYDGDDKCQYGSHKHNDKHPQIGMRLGLTYCIETTLGSKKVYSLYTEYEGIGGEIKSSRKEMHLYGDHTTVIDDTPENRLFLDNIYNKLKWLTGELSKFTESEDKLLELIKSNQLLLG